MEIFKLFGSIFVDSKAAEDSLQKTDKNAEGVGKSLLKGVGAAAKWGAGLAAAAGTAAAGLFKVCGDSAAAADEIDKMSQKIGISRTAYQELDFILSQNGMDVNQLQGGMKKLTNTMMDAKDGSESAKAAFDALGVSVTDSSGALRSQEEVMYEAIAALQGMSNETERNALANDLFGKSASEMAPLLNAGAGSMEELRQKAHDLGLVLGDETIDAGVAFTDSQDQVKRSMESVMTTIGASLMPMFQVLLAWIVANMPEIQAFLQKVFDFLSVAVEKTVEIIGWLWGCIEPYLPSIKDFCEKAWEVISGVVEAVKEAFEKYWPIISETVGAAFSSIKKFWDENLKPCLDAIIGFIRDTLWPIFQAVFLDYIQPAVETCFGFIGELWEKSLKPILTAIVDFVKNVFSGDFVGAFESIGEMLSGIWEGFISTIKGGLNLIIDAVNGFIGGLNKLTIPDWVPVVGGKGINIPKIPKLARGGVLEKGQVGYLEGSGAEAVVPLEHNRRWISAVARDMDSAMGGEQIVALLKAICELLVKIEKMGIVLDSGALVGGLAEPMDKKLGQIRAQKARA